MSSQCSGCINESNMFNDQQFGPHNYRKSHYVGLDVLHYRLERDARKTVRKYGVRYPFGSDEPRCDRMTRQRRRAMRRRTR